VNNQTVLANFYAKNMENDTLGRVAHLHLALCDILPDGACDPLAMELAKSQSVAVDFPKTGIVPQVPKKSLEIVKNEGYPDFMEKPLSKSYVSEKLLGKLYRRCNDVILNDSEISVEEWEKPNPDPSLLIAGHDRFFKEALIIYKTYSYDLLCLSSRFGLRHEEELFLGRALHWPPLLKSDKGKAMLVRSIFGIYPRIIIFRTFYVTPA
jgi:RNA-dependent RNA polymerase